MTVASRSTRLHRVQPPEVSYARSGDVAIAYQIVGEGSPDIVFVRGLTGDLLSTWEQPLDRGLGVSFSTPISRLAGAADRR